MCNSFHTNYCHVYTTLENISLKRDNLSCRDYVLFHICINYKTKLVLQLNKPCNPLSAEETFTTAKKLFSWKLRCDQNNHHIGVRIST